MKRINVAKSIAVAIALSVVVADSAQAAYLDPSTGGQLFQILAVVFTFFSAIILFLWSHIRMTMARFKRFFRGDAEPEVNTTVSSESSNE